MNKKERSQLRKEMIRMALGIDSEQEIELRGFDHQINRNHLMNFAVCVYGNAPTEFHNRNTGKFVAALLTETILEELEENEEMRLYFKSSSEKTLKEVIRKALEMEKIPRYCQSI